VASGSGRGGQAGIVEPDGHDHAVMPCMQAVDHMPGSTLQRSEAFFDDKGRGPDGTGDNGCKVQTIEQRCPVGDLLQSGDFSRHLTYPGASPQKKGRRWNESTCVMTVIA
jgi:hypothetical protein